MNENLKNVYQVLFIASSIKIATYLFKCGGCALSYLFHESRNNFFFQGKDTAEFLTKAKCPGGRQGHDLSLQHHYPPDTGIPQPRPHGPFPSLLLGWTQGLPHPWTRSHPLLLSSGWVGEGGVALGSLRHRQMCLHHISGWADGLVQAWTFVLVFVWLWHGGDAHTQPPVPFLLCIQ